MKLEKQLKKDERLESSHSFTLFLAKRMRKLILKKHLPAVLRSSNLCVGPSYWMICRTGPMTTCGIDWFSRDPIDVSYTIFIFTVHMVIPWSVSTYCYYAVFSTVSRIDALAFLPKINYGIQVFSRWIFWCFLSHSYLFKENLRA